MGERIKHVAYGYTMVRQWEAGKEDFI